jgi:hypothetical protein
MEHVYRPFSAVATLAAEGNPKRISRRSSSSSSHCDSSGRSTHCGLSQMPNPMTEESGVGSWSSALSFHRPIAGAPIVFVYSHLMHAIERRRDVISRSVLHGLTVQIDRGFAVEAAHVIDPPRRDKQLMAEPPVARLHDDGAAGA